MQNRKIFLAFSALFMTCIVFALYETVQYYAEPLALAFFPSSTLVEDYYFLDAFSCTLLCILFLVFYLSTKKRTGENSLSWTSKTSKYLQFFNFFSSEENCDDENYIEGMDAETALRYAKSNHLRFHTASPEVEVEPISNPTPSLAYPPLLKLIFCTVITLGGFNIADRWFQFVYDKLMENSFWNQSFESHSNAWMDIGDSPYLWVFLSVVVLGPICEELMFRGIIYRSFRFIRHPLAAILISSILFGIFHLEPVQVVYTFFIGMLLGTVNYAFGNIGYAIYMHMLNNFLSTPPSFMETDAFYTGLAKLSALAFLPTLFILLLIYSDKRKLEKGLLHR